MLFLGCDGGSTKTEFILADHTGNVLSHRFYPGYNYASIGKDAFRECMQSALSEVFSEAEVVGGEITHAVFGLPSYGEMEITEIDIPQVIDEILPGKCVTIVNDAVIGWSGSLGGRPGINVVAGTGSICYGEDENGHQVRVGGWSLIYGDEGSSCWIGRMVLSIFFKQSDGRLPRTALYGIFKERFNLAKKDIYFLDSLYGEPFKKPSSIAKLQLLAEEAYNCGDMSMQAVYEAAAKELVEQVVSVRNQLSFDIVKPVEVSYSGGLFKSGELIMKPFREMISRENMKLTAPEYPPYIGALAIGAGKHLDAAEINEMLKNVYEKTKPI